MHLTPRVLAALASLLVLQLHQLSLHGEGLRDSLQKFVVRPILDSTSGPRWKIIPHHELKRPRVGLVLTGGGARGASQIGAIKCLERHHVPIDFIAATSMGAIVGGLYAAGYSSAEIEDMALHTNWDDVLSLTEETRRRDLFLDQKQARERSFLTVRFQGLEPVIPSAVSSGQRLTTFLSTKVLQALYHPYPDFDDLKIPFRAVATDLNSGNRVVLKDGPLAEALRGSATVPLLFNPIDKAGMQLVDGGLVDNVPADVARDAGCDVIIVLNSTSGLRTPDQMRAPWQTADQIMGIMMQSPNEQRLKLADVVITPEMGNHLSSDFTGLDTLIAEGDHAAEEKMGEILNAYNARWRGLFGSPDSGRVLKNVTVMRDGGFFPDSVWNALQDRARLGMISEWEIQDAVDAIYVTGDFRDVQAEIAVDSLRTRVVFTVVPNVVIASVKLEGCRLIDAPELQSSLAPLCGLPANNERWMLARERILRIYRSKGYSLARIESTILDSLSGVLRVVIDEGLIRKIDVQGGVRSRDSFILREFPLQEGEVFQIDKAQQGITNINSMTLFEYVYLEVSYVSGEPVLTIRLKERPSQLVRFGLRADNERHLQGSLDIRDENFQGTGTELGFTVVGGERNNDLVLEYKARRLFDTYLTFNVSAFYRTLDCYIYGDAPQQGENDWDRLQIGEFQEIRYGGGVSFGSQLERLGKASVELLFQNVRLKNIANAQPLEERHQLGIVRLGTTVDTKDRFSFPTTGVGLTFGYEFALQALGSDQPYNALRLVYDSYSTWGERHTFHPKFTMGFADKTMPFSQQFRFGGVDIFYGLHEDDRRGRELMLLNLEYRYLLPFQLAFDSYVSARYDIGTISTVPEEIKFSTLRHGIGVALAIDTPIGPALFGLGKSFYFSRDLPKNPLQEGPFLFYFSIGYQL